MALEGLNFQRAEYGGGPVPLDHCVFCGRGITGEFYRTNGDLTCPVCAAHLHRVLPRENNEIYWRSVGFGLVVAAGASLAYLLLFRLLAQMGMADDTLFAAIAVGYAIGRAMQWAGPGARGRRYQVTAGVLTYAAVALANAATLGLRHVPVLAYPLLVLTPIVRVFLGHFQESALLLFFIGLGVRWAWMQLRPHGITISGPETLDGGSARQQTNERLRD